MKPLRIRFSEDASKEINAALSWWRANRPAASKAFKDDLRRGVALIRTQPSACPRALNVRLAGVRRLYLARVRYYVYYRVSDDGSALEVLRFWHASRGAGPPI